jgi:hypothetical protein
VGWRVNYEQAAYAVAEAVDAVPALWSGPRPHPTPPIAPIRPPIGRPPTSPPLRHARAPGRTPSRRPRPASRHGGDADHTGTPNP